MLSFSQTGSNREALMTVIVAPFLVSRMQVRAVPFVLVIVMLRFCCAVLLLLSSARAAHAAPPVVQAVLQIVAPWDVGSLEPTRAGYVFTRIGVAETLVRADPEGRFVPSLATSWTEAPDGLSWRIVLRRAIFHDGSAMTPSTVAASLRRAHQQPGPFGKVPLEAIEPEGDDAILIRLKSRFVGVPAYLAHYSTQVLAPGSFGENGAVRSVIATGPYRVSELGLPLRINVERFDGWTGGPAPAIERATYLSVPRAEARALMAESGQADITFTLDPPSLARLRRSPRVDVVALPIPRMELLKLNVGSPLFSDLKVRQAISLGIDRAGIARAILGNPEAAATQLFPPSLGTWQQADLALLRTDPDAGKRLLDEAGWRPGPDGIRSRDGRRFEATLRTYADRPELPVAAAAIQDQLRDLGMAIRVSIVNSSEIPAGHQDGTLDMALMARNYALVPDPMGTLVDDYGPKGGEWGAMGWSSPALLDALAGLQGGATGEAAAADRRVVATVLQQELPTIPVAWYDHTAAISRRLRGVVIDPFELSYNIAGMRWAE